MFRSIRSVLGACVLLVALVALAAPAASAAPPPFRLSGNVESIQGPGSFTGSSVRWMTSAQRPLTFASPRYYIVHADRTATGSGFGLTLEATAGSPVAVTELAVDRGTGRQLVVVGVPSA
jgi:hypothetical protein